MEQDKINKILNDFEKIVEDRYSKLSFQGAPYTDSFDYDEFKEMFEEALNQNKGTQKEIHFYYMTSHEMACGISDCEDNLIFTTKEKFITCKICIKNLNYNKE